MAHSQIQVSQNLYRWMRQHPSPKYEGFVDRAKEPRGLRERLDAEHRDDLVEMLHELEEHELEGEQ